MVTMKRVDEDEDERYGETRGHEKGTRGDFGE